MNKPRPPICCNCKHFSGNMKLPRCKAILITNLITNLITGAIMRADCHPERATGTKCGPDGKLFIIARSI